MLSGRIKLEIPERLISFRRLKVESISWQIMRIISDLTLQMGDAQVNQCKNAGIMFHCFRMCDYTSKLAIKIKHSSGLLTREKDFSLIPANE